MRAYPYGVRSTASEEIRKITGSDVPYVRADWFVFQASTPPLYHDILRLPPTIKELETQNGVDVERDFNEEHNFFRAGMSVSHVSLHNRIVERHDSVNGAYWRSYDFRSSEGENSIFLNPLTFKASGGEIIFNLPNGLQAYLLADAEGKRLDGKASAEIVQDVEGGIDVQVINGRSCMGCHSKGMREAPDVVRSSVLNYASFPNRDKVLAVYPEQAELNQLLKADGERFEKAILATGGQTTTPDPINELSKKYNKPLTLALAAAELGLEASAFKQNIRENQALGHLGFAQLLAPGGAYQRDAWEGTFSEVARDLHLGNPAEHVLIRGISPLRAATVVTIPDDPFLLLYGTWVLDTAYKENMGRCHFKYQAHAVVSISKEDQIGAVLKIQYDQTSLSTMSEPCKFKHGLRELNSTSRFQWVIRPTAESFRVKSTRLSCRGDACVTNDPGDGILTVKEDDLVLDLGSESITLKRR